MPLYESECKICGKRHEYAAPVSLYRVTPSCCGEPTVKRVFTSPYTVMDIAPWEPYQSPSTGKWITSKRERRADLKQSGCREWEGIGSEARQAARNRQYEEEARDQKLEQAAIKAYKDLPESKKALL
jgi:hypothetical protein